MKIIRALSTGYLLLILMSFGSDNLPKKFTDLLHRANMSFQKPTGLEETQIIENRQINYEFAIKYPKNKFEVRYAIRPLDNLIFDYDEKEKNKKQGDINIHPNKLYSSLLQTITLNISGGRLSKVTIFDKEIVKKEFNADWGATTFVEVGKEFGQNYKYCMIVAIHKDNFADAYFFYLSDTKERFDELMNPAFHSLKFK